MKILVIQTSRFGDLLQTTPMLHTLRRRYSKADITVLSRYNVLEVYRDNPDVDHVELFNIEEYTERLMAAPSDIFSYYAELRDSVKHLKAKGFDMVINITHDRFSSFLTYLISPPEIRGMFLSPDTKLRLQVNGFWFQYLRCASNFRTIASFNLVDIYKNIIGGDCKTEDLYFSVPPASKLKAEELLPASSQRTFIGFQLGTSTNNRRWPARYFAQLGDMIQKEDGEQVVFLGTKNEKWLGDEVTGLMKKRPINLIGETNITELAGVLSRCSLLVTNDTGTMHLAEAVGTKCIALFFESANPYQTGPYGAGHIICSPDLDCFPCSTIEECEDKKCLDMIPSESVFNLVRYQLGLESSGDGSIGHGTRIHETLISRFGIWDAWPLNPTLLQKQDLIRKIYRNMWIRYSFSNHTLDNIRIEQSPDEILSEELNEWIQCYHFDGASYNHWLKDFKTNLNKLKGLSTKGLSIIREITSLNSRGLLNGSTAVEKSNKLGKIDQKIKSLGESNLWLSQLVNLFNLELEQISDSNFFIMLNKWKQTYNDFKFRIELLLQEIEIIKGVLDKNE